MNIEETRKLEGNEERGSKTILVQLESEGHRKEIWENKKKLRGRNKRIVEDLT